MVIEQLKRKFVIDKGNKNETILTDINLNLDFEAILEHYAPLYPELTTAKIVDEGIVNGERKIVFKTIAGTKG